MIVVGIDGSAGSDAALRWALAEARLRAVSVRAVNVYQSPPLLADGVGMGSPGLLVPVPSEDVQGLGSAAEAEARRVLDEALARSDALRSGVEVEAEAVEGPPPNR